MQFKAGEIATDHPRQTLPYWIMESLRHSPAIGVVPNRASTKKECSYRNFAYSALVFCR
jgi:hypothetical protein